MEKRSASAEKALEQAVRALPPSVLGQRLRRARLRQNRSIRDLAALAGLSKNSIVRLEKGEPGHFGTIVKVCSAMGLHLAGLTNPEESIGRSIAVHRREDDQWFDMTDFGAGPLGELSLEERHQAAKVPLMMIRARLENGRLLPALLEIYEASEKRSHPGEEMVYVLSGSLLLSVGEQETRLEVGECATFWSAEAHGYAPADGSELPVRILSVRSDDSPG